MFVPVHNETSEVMLGKTQATAVSHVNIGEAHRRSLRYAGTEGVLAPSYTLLPYLPSLPGTVVPHTEEIYGFDHKGIYYTPGTPVVITYHGGRNSVLSPQKKLQALALHEHAANVRKAARSDITVREDDDVLEARIRNNFNVGFLRWARAEAEVYSSEPLSLTEAHDGLCYEAPHQGITRVGTVVLDEIYPGEDVYTRRDIVGEMLAGRMPDGSPLVVFPYGWYFREGAPSGYKPHAVVRPLDLVRESFSGYQELGNLLDDTGRVKDSQLVVLAGGGQRPYAFLQRLCDGLRKREIAPGWGSIGLSHPYNHSAFDESTPQARWLSLSSQPGAALGEETLPTFGRYIVVPQI
ncbi:hypothetical protein HYW21_01885 [Candidatus Woesearchaeota archaeon]|nr:hypothetical protein [Candidatus Woesearchaeota archaeon]